MAITYSWTINSMSVTQNPDPNTVVMVNFSINGTDGTYNGQVTYSVGLPAPTGSFTPYNELTQEQVVGWVQSVLGTGNIATQASMEAEVNAQIAAQSVSTPQPEPLPWNPPATETVEPIAV